MSFTEITKSLIKDINDLNTFMTDQKIEHKINMETMIEKIVNQEKEHTLIKHSLENCKNNLDKNIELLQKKCDIEYKIYEVLVGHKTKLNELKKNSEIELPKMDHFTKNLFNISNFIEIEIENEIEKQKPVINRSNANNDNGNKRMSGNTLQDQLAAAITARRAPVVGEQH